MKISPKIGSMLALSVLLAACASPTAAPTAVPTKPAAPAPTAAPTAAPAPTTAPTVAPTAAPTAVPTPDKPKELVVDKAKLSKQLNVYTWSGYFSDDLVKAFEKEYGLKVKIDTYEENEEMYAKFKAGGNPGYDIIVPSDYMVAKMIKDGLADKIDFNNVPNIANIDPAFRKMNFDPTGEYSIAHFWGTTGFAYDTAKVKRELTSWKDILEPEKDIQGRIAMINDTREALSAALRLKGFSANTGDAKAITQAKDVLIAQKKFVKAYQASPENSKLLVAGQVWVAHIYTGDAIQAIAEKPTIKYVIPDDVSTVFVDNAMIPKGAKNKYTAEVFLNYFLDAKNAGANANTSGFPSPNAAALKGSFIDKAMASNAAMYPDMQKMAKKLELLQIQDAKTEELFDKAWTEIGIQ